MLQSKDYLLSEAMIKIKNAKTTLKLSKNKIGGIINVKRTTLLRKNPGYKIMKTISKILEGCELILYRLKIQNVEWRRRRKNTLKAFLYFF